MKGHVILARIEVNDPQGTRVAGHLNHLNASLMKVEGYRGVSLWRNEHVRSRFLVLFQYADSEAAATGFRTMTSEVPPPSDSLLSPPDVIPIPLTSSRK